MSFTHRHYRHVLFDCCIDTGRFTRRSASELDPLLSQRYALVLDLLCNKDTTVIELDVSAAEMCTAKGASLTPGAYVAHNIADSKNLVVAKVDTQDDCMKLCFATDTCNSAVAVTSRDGTTLTCYLKTADITARVGGSPDRFVAIGCEDATVTGSDPTPSGMPCPLFYLVFPSPSVCLWFKPLVSDRQ
jgi:hypothetical protein